MTRLKIKMAYCAIFIASGCLASSYKITLKNHTKNDHFNPDKNKKDTPKDISLS
jgi:hypothetical protein